MFEKQLLCLYNSFMHKEFGSYLKFLRKSKGITQENLANGIGVSTVYIHQLETGKVDAPSKTKCFEISKVLKTGKKKDVQKNSFRWRCSWMLHGTKRSTRNGKLQT